MSGIIVGKFSTPTQALEQFQAFGIITAEEADEVMNFLREHKVAPNAQLPRPTIEGNQIKSGNAILMLQPDGNLKTGNGRIIRLSATNAVPVFTSTFLAITSRHSSRLDTRPFIAEARADDFTSAFEATIPAFSAIYYKASLIDRIKCSKFIGIDYVIQSIQSFLEPFKIICRNGNYTLKDPNPYAEQIRKAYGKHMSMLTIGDPEIESKAAKIAICGTPLWNLFPSWNPSNSLDSKHRFEDLKSDEVKKYGVPETCTETSADSLTTRLVSEAKRAQKNIRELLAGTTRGAPNGSQGTGLITR